MPAFAGRTASPKLDFGDLPKITIASPWKIRHREYQPDQTVQPDGCGLTSVAPAQASQSLRQHIAIAVSVKQRRAFTDGAIRRLPGFE